MTDHLCVTLNPVVDTTFHIDRFTDQYRTEASRIMHVAGGKGNNVGRVLIRLGERARVFNPLGGVVGRQLMELLSQDGVKIFTAWLSVDTRLAVTLMDKSGEQRAYFAPTSPWNDSDVRSVRTVFQQALDGAQTLCVCGSSPNRQADGLFAEFLAQARDRGVFTLLDSYGMGLKEGLKAAPQVVKMNRMEAGDYLGRDLSSMDACCQAVENLSTLSGVEWVVLTMGAEGALLGTDERIWLARPPKIAVVNPIGSGDSMTGGLLARYRQGGDPLDCFRLGMAAAAANAQTYEAGLVELQEIDRLEKEIIVEALR